MSLNIVPMWTRGFAKKEEKAPAGGKKKLEKLSKADKTSDDIDMKGNKDMALLLSIVDAPRRKLPVFSEEQQKKNFEIGRR